jgi:preprotein translocase subunit SecA
MLLSFQLIAQMSGVMLETLFTNRKCKYTALADEVIRETKKGQPVLISTTSIEKNEIVKFLTARKLHTKS